jgi:predicted amidohydrolase YtcJ
LTLAGGLAQAQDTAPPQEPIRLEAPEPADIVIHNAKFWTGADSAKPDSDITGVAIDGGRIRAVGSDEFVMLFFAPGTKLIDGKGRRVIPGITDSHTHMISGGLQLERLDLRDAKNKEEFIERVAEAAKGRATADWILGGRWSVESWENPETPRASWLDAVTGDVPAFLMRMDGHGALANSAAMRHGGISKDGPPDPVGGEIERDPATGEPTGILKESAMQLVARAVPEPKSSERRAALKRALQHANSFGITSVHDMCHLPELVTFKGALLENELTVRVSAYLTSDDWFQQAGPLIRNKYELKGDMLRAVGLKAYMDGSLGSRTAYMRDRFADATSETKYPRGQLTAFASTAPDFHRKITLIDRGGLQAAVHAIGDEAIHLLLDAFEEASRANGTLDRLHRIEHAQHILPRDIPRFEELRVVASMQPFHKADDGRYAEKALGKDRLEGSYAFRQLVDSGALVIFGSDWPVVTMNPFAGIDSAVNAKTLSGEVWLPSHSLTVEEALRAYTVWPAKAVKQDKVLGTIEAGKLADIVILQDDVLTIPKDKIKDVKVAYTIVDGKIVYQAPGEP